MNALQSILFFLLLINCTSCVEEPTKPPIDPNEPIANAGENQTINVGSYFVLDGSRSTKGNGDTLIYKWTENASNPEHVFLFGDPIYYKIVIKPGTYKYTLIVNNGIKNSKPTELIITIKPRGNIVFNDPTLEAEIRFVLQKQTGDLTDPDLLIVDSIRVGSYLQSNNKISNLHGIEKCKNLKQLLLSLQSITDLSPLASLTSLERLDIDQNFDLNDVSPLANLIRLKHLMLFNTKIASISSLSNLNILEYINVGLTKVKDIFVVSNFKKLKEFWGDQLPIINLSLFSDLKELELLYLVFSQLKDISALSNLSKIKQIEISGNQISDIAPLLRLTELITLRITDNNIRDITPLQNLTKLTDIWLSRNKIEDIKPLVDNTSLGNGVVIMLVGNPLNEKSINDYIPQLRARGVSVYW